MKETKKIPEGKRKAFKVQHSVRKLNKARKKLPHEKDFLNAVKEDQRWFDTFENMSDAVFSCAVKLDKLNRLSVKEMKLALSRYLHEHKGMNTADFSNLKLYPSRDKALSVALSGSFFRSNKFLSKESPCYYEGIYCLYILIVVIILLLFILFYSR